MITVDEVERHVDRVHLQSPVMGHDLGVSIPQLILVAETQHREVLRQSGPGTMAGNKFLDLVGLSTDALDQCVDWILDFRDEPQAFSKRSSSEDDYNEFLSLATRYLQLVVLFTAYHRGEARHRINEDLWNVHFVVPQRIVTYHNTALAGHQVDIPESLAFEYREKRTRLLKSFLAAPAKPLPSELWRDAFDCVMQVTSADWDLSTDEDLGGYNIEQARRFGVALRLLGELWLFSGAGIPVFSYSVLVNLMSNYTGIDREVVRRMVPTLCRTRNNVGPSHMFPFYEISANELLAWSPTKVVFMNQQRELLRRLARSHPSIHNRLSDAKHRALTDRFVSGLAVYGHISVITNLELPVSDIDAALVDTAHRVICCVELKAMLTPRSLREALDVDERKSRSGKTTDGLSKGARVQMPRILGYVRDSSDDFMQRLMSLGVDIDKPFTVWGCVVSSWTLGTGLADGKAVSQDGNVPIVTVPIFLEQLRAVGGDLAALKERLTRRSHLADSQTRDGRLAYGDYEFEWETSDATQWGNGV